MEHRSIERWSFGLAMEKRTTYDVIVAGAGPVGLFLAGELALAGCSVLVIEKEAYRNSPLKRVPFGIRGLSAPTIEALDRRGLLSELDLHKRMTNPHQNAKAGSQRQGGHFAGISFLDGNVDASRWKERLPSSTPTHMLSEMGEMESALARWAEALGVRTMRGAGVTGFRQTEDEVTVLVGDEPFAAKWLVGCDGSRSVVRKAGGFAFAGTEPEFTGYSMQVDLADTEKLGQGRVATPVGMYFQSQPGYLVMVEFDQGAAHGAGELTPERLQATLRRVSESDVTIRALHAATTWTDRARQATTYRKGRVLLAGDAAHIHSPLGGQGLNLGLGDAMNLGWKLAATVRGSAPEGLLDTYQAERHPLGAQVLDWSRAQVAVMRPDPEGRALSAIFRDLLATRDGATYVAGRVWGVHARYDLGNESPLAGGSVPNFEFEDGTTVAELMRDGRGALLDFEGHAMLEAVASEFGGLRYVAGPVKERLGVRAVLVRPDGIVAWASEGDSARDELRRAAGRWFAPLH